MRIVTWVLALVLSVGALSLCAAGTKTSLQWGVDRTVAPWSVCLYDSTNACEPIFTFSSTGGTVGFPTTSLTGTLQAAQEPAHTGDVTNSAGSLNLSIANGVVTNAKLASGVAAANLGFTPSYVINLLDPAYGGHCDGAVSGYDDAAITAAVNFANAHGNVAIYVPDTPTQHECVVTQAAPTITGANICFITGGFLTGQIINTSTTADTLTWSGTSYGCVKNVWLRRFIDPTAGANVHLINVTGFDFDAESRDAFYNIEIEGGSAIFLEPHNSTAGQYYSTYRAGSSLVYVGPYYDGTNYHNASEIFLNNYNLKAYPNSPQSYVGYSINLVAVDGFFAGDGHAGFSRDCVINLAPAHNGTSVETVHVSGMGMDGNSQTSNGWCIPAIAGGVTSHVRDISHFGGSIEGFTGDGALVQESTAQLTLNTIIQNINGWGVQGTAYGRMIIQGAMSNVGATGNVGMIYLAGGVGSIAQIPNEVLASGKSGQYCLQGTATPAKGTITTDGSCTYP